jgi:uncharacterized membrane protein YbhN (UPF0104 family)
LPAAPRRVARVVLQVLVTAAVLVFAGREVAREWDRVRPLVEAMRPDWALIAAASAIVLATYALLIQVWRTMLASWGRSLPPGAAARIWFVSNLGKYVPGKVWQIGAMWKMAERRGVSPAASVGSSLVINLVNIITGFALVLMTGAGALETSGADPTLARRTAFVMVAIGVLAIAAAPLLLPLAARLASAVLRRPIQFPLLPAAARWVAAAGPFASWGLYGRAFRVFTAALLGEATGGTSAYLAVYTASYLAGYLALVVPGGVGVREVVIIAAMQRFGLATVASATVVAWASRLWLTVLEILPGLLFLARADRGSPAPTPGEEDVSSR